MEQYDQEEQLISNMDEEELLELAKERCERGGAPIKMRIVKGCNLDMETVVGEICDDLQMNQSAVSHQLKQLRAAKLVKGRRCGKAIYYSLADDHVSTIIAMGRDHIEEC